MQTSIKYLLIAVTLAFSASAQAGEVSRALELLTLVKHHSASTYEIREKAHKMWGELAAELSPDVIAETKARGMALDLWKTAEELTGADHLTITAT